eukprot:763275-Hanusia_phi.AAC.1
MESRGQPTERQPKFGQMPDPLPPDYYAYKSVGQAYQWATDFEGLKKDDVVLNAALDKEPRPTLQRLQVMDMNT